MMAAIHPLQVLALGFGQWKKNLWRCAGIVAALYGPFVALVVVSAMAIAAAMQAKVLVAAGIIIFVLLVLGVFVFNAAPAAVILAAQAPAGIIASIRRGSAYALKVFAVNLLSMLALGGVAVLAGLTGFLLAQTAGKANAVLGGMLTAAAVLAGLSMLVFLAVRLSMAVYVCVMENKGPLVSINRSVVLTRRRFFPMAGVFLLCIGVSLAVFSPALVASMLLPKAAQQVPQIVMRVCAELFLTPFFINVSLVIFGQLKPVETKHA